MFKKYPLAYSIRCLVEEPIKVEHHLKHGESFTWRGIEFTAYDFPGQTYWHDGLYFEVDGKKYFISGDAIYDPEHGQDDCCRNYIRLEEDDGMLASAQLLRKLGPDFLMTGHWGLWKVSPEDFDYLIAYTKKILPLAKELIGQPDRNMGFDEQWASCYPYRTITKRGSEISLAVQIRNHLGRAVEAKADLRCPEDWKVTPRIQSATIEAKSTGRLEFKVTLPEKVEPGRYIITGNVTFAGKDYGELAEAVVDVKG